MSEVVLKWWKVLEAHYGIKLEDEMRLIWETYLLKAGIKGTNLCLIIEEASMRGLLPRAYKVTVADLIAWVEMSKRNWSKNEFRGF